MVDRRVGDKKVAIRNVSRGGWGEKKGVSAASAVWPHQEILTSGGKQFLGHLVETSFHVGKLLTFFSQETFHMPGILGYLLSLLKPLTVHHPAIGCPPRQNSWPAWSLFNLAFAASQPSMPLYRLHNLKLYDFYDVTNIFMGRALRGRASLGSPGGSSWISQKARRALRKG